MTVLFGKTYRVTNSCFVRPNLGFIGNGFARWGTLGTGTNEMAFANLRKSAKFLIFYRACNITAGVVMVLMFLSLKMLFN